MSLTTEEKLRIANSGGFFQETGQSSWVGKKIRKGNKLGVVTCDMNGAWRILAVRFEDNTEEKIQMNNIGPDFEGNSQYEWLYVPRNNWYRF